MIATLSPNDEKTKELLIEVMIDLIKTKRDVLHEIIQEALEEVGWLMPLLKAGITNLFLKMSFHSKW